MTTGTIQSNLLISSKDTSQPPPTSPIEAVFNESQCLFCNQVNSNVNQNIEHMSKLHGLYIDLTDLLVDVESLLNYMHLLIFQCHECIFCGSQRNTCQAVQQHMVAKGHCKYDPGNEESELYDFFGRSDLTDEVQRAQIVFDRFSNQAQLSSRMKSRKSAQARQSDTTTQLPINTAQFPDTNSGSSSDSEGRVRSQSNALSTRVLKQEHTLQNQLSQLRAGDRQSLAHLPASQQRALLATRYKQMEQGRRAEQTYHSHLESAGNKSGRLSTIRLIRKPPHTGNVHSLNR